jgi:serine phosphatase RsbU (regulator of sigma subunit)
VTLLSQLGRMESGGLIQVAQVEPDLHYAFRHALVQDAAYASLLISDRQRLHHAVGRAIEDLYPDRLDEYAAMLARHFAGAGESRQALAYFLRAGDTALAAYANQEAENHYRSALALDPGPDSAQKGHLLSGMGEALYRQSRYEEAREAWTEAIDLYRQAQDSQAVARLYARSARAASYASGYRQSLSLCREGLGAVAGAPESGELARLLHEMARAYYFSGQSDKAERLCRRVLDMAERCGTVEIQAEALATLGILPQRAGEKAISDLRQAVELAESAGLLELARRAHHNLASNLFIVAADLEGAYRHFVRAGDLARRRGDAHQEILSLVPAMGIVLECGPAAEIEALLARLQDLSGAPPHAATLADIQATVLQRQGAWQQALDLRRHSYDETQRRGSQEAIYEAGSVLAWLLLEMDRLDEFASDHDRQAALAEAEEILVGVIGLDPGSLGGGIRATCQLAALRARQGRLAEARAILAEAPAEASQKGLTWQKMMVREAAGWIAVVDNDWTEAISAFQEAAAESQRLGIRWHGARQVLLWAEALLSRGRPADVDHARGLLREARDTFRDLSAGYYAALAARRLEESRSRSHDHAAALTRASHELAAAGRIQAGLLPQETPYLPGWQFAAVLEPARETSGDFYDFIRLAEGRLGLVIADVADKGVGAALYMTLTRTLLRTYAAGHPHEPAAVLEAVNRRLISEADTDMFVTLFYAVLEPDEATLIYANAGHNPPLLLRVGGRGKAEPLAGTGMALGIGAGILPDAAWQQAAVQLNAGDALILYTDGVVDARTPEGEAFGLERLLASVQSHLGADASELAGGILAEIHHFVGDAPRFDDLTLVVVARI